MRFALFILAIVVTGFALLFAPLMFMYPVKRPFSHGAIDIDAVFVGISVFFAVLVAPLWAVAMVAERKKFSPGALAVYAIGGIGGVLLSTWGITCYLISR